MIARILREPFFYFVGIGAILFIVYGARNDEPISQDPKQIIITQDRIDQLGREFQSVWKRPPEPHEQEKIVESYIYEEILVREALALGMDKGDSVIRQRLHLKMEFLASGAAKAIQPGDQEIEKYYQENIENFSHPKQLAFEQVYLGNSASQSDVTLALDSLNSGASPLSVGQRSLMPPGMPMSQTVQVNSVFGSGFFDQLWSVQSADWQGPLQSGYGLHLVRVTERQEVTARALSEVRDAVISQLQEKIASEMASAQKAALLAEYAVVRPADTQ